MAEARKRLFEEALGLYKTFKSDQIKKARLLCKQALNEHGDFMKEFEDLLEMIELWLEYDKKR